ncbi:MAG: hypothetical protein ABF636_02830 [Acetobacter sp.]
MIILLRFAGLGLALVVALLFAVFVGDQGPWYFAWAVGTVMIILVAAAGGVLFDAQTDASAPEEEF